jgi:biopolymer transport protein ExbD
MASIEESGGGGHKKGPGVKKAKKLSTHLDMTPMVDLGFLLITFFIFTTTMSSPTTMELFMPKDTDKDDEQNKAKESGALTIMLSKDNHVYYYEGQLNENASNFKQASFSLKQVIRPEGDTIKSIRQVIIDKKKAVIDAHQHDAGCEKIWAKNGGDKTSCLDKDLVIVIKPGELATYKNTVDILDEMTITNIKRYAMVDLFPAEKALIEATEGK